MEDTQYLTLSKSLKRFLAIAEVQNDKGLLEILTKESQDELKKRLKDAEKEIPFRILTAYRHLALSGEKSLEWKDMGIPTVETDVAISERVKQYLKDQEKILSCLTPRYIIDRAFPSDENEKRLQDIFELFLKTPGMPVLENEDVLFETVKEGVRSGFLGVREGSEVYHQQDVLPTIDAIVLRGEVAKKMKETEAKAEEKEGETVREPDKEIIKAGEKPGKLEEGVVKNLTLRAKIPWDKLSEITRGVIRPLKDKRLSPEITIEIKVGSKEGFDRTTLDSKVKETLTQINAKIEEWREE